ncbi:MAG: hypothetical protein Q9183_004763 [Haloplaca sp. 2 TL-2023]
MGTDKKGLSTIFEVLDIYEPSIEFEAAPDIVHPPPAPLDYTVKTEEDLEFEAPFAMTAMMDDLSRLRTIELARSYEDDIRRFMEKQGGSSIFHVKYFGAVSEALGIDALLLLSNHSGAVEDQLMHGMITTLKTAKRERKGTPDVPLWFSFAAQIYLDLLDVVKVGKGWTDLQYIMHIVREAVDELPTSCKERQTMLKPLELWDKDLDPIALIRTSLGQPYKDYTYCRRNFFNRRPISVDVVEDWIKKSNASSTNNNIADPPIPANNNNNHYPKKAQPLIHRLATTLESEIPDLQYDHFAIHTLYHSLLYRLQT